MTMEKYEYNIRRMAIFCAGKLNMAFMKNWTMTEKGCPFHFKSYHKEKLPGFTEISFSTALSTRYLNCFVMVPRDRWDASVCLSYHLALFLSVLVFMILGIFSTFFSQTSYSYLYSSFLFWENILLLTLIWVGFLGNRFVLGGERG